MELDRRRDGRLNVSTDGNSARDSNWDGMLAIALTIMAGWIMFLKTLSFLKLFVAGTVPVTLFGLVRGFGTGSEAGWKFQTILLKEIL